MKAFGPAAPDPAVMARLRDRLDNAFGILDKHLAGRTFVVGEAPTIADMSLCGYLFYPVAEAATTFPAQFGHVAAWLERVRRCRAGGPTTSCRERLAPRW